MPFQLKFFVPGTPAPAGSKRAFVVGLKSGKPRAVMQENNSDRLHVWYASVAEHAARAMGDRQAFTGPITLDIIFHMMRPKSHRRTGKFAGQVKPSAPAYHVQKPDRSKLLRAAEDALTGIVYVDDSQIVGGNTTKMWTTDKSGAVFQINELEYVPW